MNRFPIPLFLLLLACSASGCGGIGETEFIVGGFPSPNASLDAMIQAIRSGNLKAYKDCWGLNPLEPKNNEKVFAVYDNSKTPKAIEASWKEQFQFWREDHWKEGKYKRFPQEIAGSNASITCALTLDRYARYEFRKLPGGWYLSAHVVIGKNQVAPKYLWKENDP